MASRKFSLPLHNPLASASSWIADRSGARPAEKAVPAGLDGSLRSAETSITDIASGRPLAADATESRSGRVPIARPVHSVIFKLRGVVGILCFVPVIALLSLSQPFVRDGSWADVLLDACGWVCLLVYAWMRVWATLFAGGRKDRELQTEGPYSMTRNPLYFGSLFLAFAAVCFVPSALLLVATLVMVVVYVWGVIPAEERLLEALFGQQFRDYVQRTPRLLPRYALLRQPAALEVNLRTLAREATRICGAAIIPLAAELLEKIRATGWSPWHFILF